MNRQTLFKLTSTIFCSLLLLGISQKLSHNLVALAQNTVNRENPLKNPSPQEARNSFPSRYRYRLGSLNRL